VVGDLKTSTLNPHAFEVLTGEGVKDRTHYGFMNGWDNAKLKKANVAAYDITKCYLSCLSEPFEPFYIVGFSQSWEPCDKLDGVGLYWVDTDDHTLLCGSNAYTLAILKKAQAHGISFQVSQVLRASETLPIDYFTKIIKHIVAQCDDDAGVYKFIINMLSGCLGRTKREHVDLKISTNVEQVWAEMTTHAHNRDKLKVEKVEMDGVELFLYGVITETLLTACNLPVYLQMKDFANMRLFDMVQAAGGFSRCIARKTDCIIVDVSRGDLLATRTGTTWGSWRPCKPPVIYSAEKEKGASFEECNEWRMHDINDSADVASIAAIIKERGGCLVSGRAGTGKSHIIKQMSQHFPHIEKIAPTNKAALNIQGKTIHRFLKMDASGQVSKKTFLRLRQQKPLIVLDECSMVSGKLWAMLLDVKRYTGCPFLIMGDLRQCAPVEDTGLSHYFDHPAVKTLASFQRVDLTKTYRYDETMKTLSDNIDRVPRSKTTKPTRLKLCYTNKTRKTINERWNRAEAPAGSVYVPAPEKDEHTQGVYLYKGLPCIARKTVKGGDALINNETYDLVDVGDTLRFITTRPNDEGQPEQHEFTCKREDFHEFYLMAYCITTHKAQGQTFTEPFTIYDWNIMDRFNSS
jgi:hypothetical protein